MTPLRILISGAGIAGNTLALCLSNQGHDVTVVERFSSLRTTGLQIDLRGHGIEVIKRLGLEQAFRTKSVLEEGVQVVDSSGKRRAYFAANKSGKGIQSFTSDYEIMRGDFCRLLYDATKDRVKYIFGATIKSFDEQDHSINVHFENGKTDCYDLMVSADGVHSSIRKMMFGSRSAGLHPLAGQYVAYFSIPQPLKSDEKQVATWHTGIEGRAMMTRRHGPDEIQVYLGGRSDSERLRDARPGDVEEEKAAVAEIFIGAGGKVEEMSRHLADATDFYCERLAMVKLDSWSRGRAVLVGDAAYCPSANTGMGTTSAVVGAYILAGEISRHHSQSNDKVSADNDGVISALEAYERIFRPFMTQVQKGVAEGSGWNIETSLGLAMLHGFLGMASFLKINIFRWMMPEEIKGWDLPDYADLLQK